MRGGGVCIARKTIAFINNTFYKNMFTNRKKCGIINLRRKLNIMPPTSKPMYKCAFLSLIKMYAPHWYTCLVLCIGVY